MKKILILIIISIIVNGCSNTLDIQNKPVVDTNEPIASTPDPATLTTETTETEPKQTNIPQVETTEKKQPTIKNPETPTENKKSDFIDMSLESGNNNRGVIIPDQISVNVGDKVRWTNRNVRDHIISCRVEFGNQIFKGEKISPGEFSEVIFEKTGKYICVDVLYGARSTVIVN